MYAANLAPASFTPLPLYIPLIPTRQPTPPQSGRHSASDSEYCRESSDEMTAKESCHSSDCGFVRPSEKPRHRVVNGKAVVVTPWYPDGVFKDSVYLTDEAVALYELLRLSHEEKEQRNSFRFSLQHIVRRHCNGATVKVYGSAAYDTLNPDSRLDMVVEGCEDLQCFPQLVASLGMKVEFHVMDTPSEAFARVTSHGVTANITFTTGRSPLRANVAILRDLLDKFAGARAAFAIIRLILAQSKCGDPSNGGMSSYACLIMLLHCCWQSVNPHDCGQLLLDFFQLYSIRSNWMITALSADRVPVPPGTCGLYVADVTTSNNVADHCTRVPQVLSAFNNCHLTLAKWFANRSSGYKGRTPLSCIVAFDSLWERADLLAEARFNGDDVSCDL